MSVFAIQAPKINQPISQQLRHYLEINEKQIKKDAETCILFSIHINETFYPLIAISPPKKHLDPHFEVQPYKPPTLVALAM